MSKGHGVLDALHEATHRAPGVPQHQDHPTGHRGSTRHGQSFRKRPLQDRGAGSHHGSVRAHDRPPRVLVGWQNWIAGLFSRKTG
jgi:hypothetical protein